MKREKNKTKEKATTKTQIKQAKRKTQANKQTKQGCYVFGRGESTHIHCFLRAPGRH